MKFWNLAAVPTRVLPIAFTASTAFTPRLPYRGVWSRDQGSLRTHRIEVPTRRASVDHDGRRIVDVVRDHLNGGRRSKSRKRRWENRDHCRRGRSNHRSKVRYHIDGSRANIDRYVRHTSRKAKEKGAVKSVPPSLPLLQNPDDVDSF